MATINDMKKIFFPTHKRNHVVTSTPIKKHTSTLLKIDQWPSPVEKILIPSESLIISQSLIESSSKKENLCPVDNDKEKELKESATTAIKSMDKICLVNNLPEANNHGELMKVSDDKTGSKNIEKERWIIVDSEEEDILRSKTESLKRKKKATSLTDKENLAREKKSRKLTEEKIALANVEETESKKSDDKVNEVKPRVTNTVTKKDIPHSKSAMGILKLGQRDESSDNSDLLLINGSQKKRTKTIGQVDENLYVRKSTRKRCKPLEFWNGERMENVRDVAPDFGENGTKKNGKRTEVKKVKNAESGYEEVERVQKVSKIVPNVVKSRKSKGNLSVKKISDKKTEEKTLSKSAKSRNSKTKVGFSDIEITSAIDKNLNLGGQMNSVQLETLAKHRLPKNENFLSIPRLKNVMGIISSSVIVMKSETFRKNKSSEQHHLIFCVMSGTVKAVIDAESESASAEIKPCGHFVVPCGASYSIENFNKSTAIISCFEIKSRD